MKRQLFLLIKWLKNNKMSKKLELLVKYLTVCKISIN
jgi:hypothetical protein